MRIEATKVSVLYNGIPALRDISFEHSTNELMIVTGPAGAGKTTLLNLLSADLLPSLGSVAIEGTATSSMSKTQKRMLHRRLGIVDQHCELIPYMDVYDNVRHPMVVQGQSRADASAAALQILADLGVSYVRSKYPHELSGGARHLVAIARALVTGPEIILADEPTGTLDDVTAMGVIDVLKSAHSNGTGMIISTHSQLLEAAFPAATRLHIQEGMSDTNYSRVSDTTFNSNILTSA